MACAGSRIERCDASKDATKGILSVFGNGVFIGNAVRIGENLVLPAHVGDVGDTLSGPQSSIADFHSYGWQVRRPGPESDLLFIELPRQAWSKLGVPALSVGMGDMAVATKVIHLDGAGVAYQSHGPIAARVFNEKHTFGIHYGSSTTPGWSGAPVFQRGKVVGIHVAGDHSVGKNIYLSLLPNMVAAEVASGVAYARSEASMAGSYSSDRSPDYDLRKWDGPTRQDYLADQQLNGGRYIVTKKGLFTTLTSDQQEEYDDFVSRQEYMMDRPDAWSNLVDDESSREAKGMSAAVKAAEAVVEPVRVPTAPAAADGPKAVPDFRAVPLKTQRDTARSEQPSPSSTISSISPEMLRLALKAFEPSDESTDPLRSSDSSLDTSSLTGYQSFSTKLETTTGPTTLTSRSASSTQPVVDPNPPPRSKPAKRRKRKPSSPTGTSVPVSKPATGASSATSSEVKLTESAFRAILEEVIQSTSPRTGKSLKPSKTSSSKRQ